MNLWDNREFNVMLLKEVNKLIKSKEYIYEIKFDGIRACIFGNNKSIKIISRNKKDITNLFPELVNIKEMFNKNTILDGEIICLLNNKISFDAIQERMHLKNKDKIKLASNNNSAIFVAFDILYLDKNLIDLSLIERKKILNNFKESDNFIISKTYADSLSLFKFVKKNNMEGIVAKLKNSKYLINTRSENWLKIKNYQTNYFYIGGYEKKKNKYISVKLGEYQNGKLIYVGSASLMNNSVLYLNILNLKILSDSPFENYDEKIVYVKVKLKCKVKYIEKTKNNQLRQPIIMGDKNEFNKI